MATEKFYTEVSQQADYLESWEEDENEEDELLGCWDDEDEVTETYGRYPLDLWFLLSEYISPEQVKTFSQICVQSYAVVNTPRFWINLYKRWYRKVNMPDYLQPHCLEVHHGLKVNVIRALYYTYQPFKSSAQEMFHLNNFDLLEDLIGMQCLIVYIEKIPNQQFGWAYKFKLKKITNNKKASRKVKDRLRTKDDININPDEGCKILFLPCKDFRPIPCVTGYRLKKVSGFWNQVKLVFTLGPAGSMSSTEDVTLNLTPTTRASLFDWWHPMFHSMRRPPSSCSVIKM